MSKGIQYCLYVAFLHLVIGLKFAPLHQPVRRTVNPSRAFIGLLRWVRLLWLGNCVFLVRRIWILNLRREGSGTGSDFLTSELGRSSGWKIVSPPSFTRKAYTEPHWSFNKMFSISSKVASTPTTPIVLGCKMINSITYFVNKSKSKMLWLQRKWVEVTLFSAILSRPVTLFLTILVLKDPSQPHLTQNALRA